MTESVGLKRVCPNCTTKLENIQIRHGVVWTCSTCKGRAIGVGLLQKISKPELIQKIWVKATRDDRRIGKPCPSCHHPMLVVKTDPELGSVDLDVCKSCYFIWFDQNELDKIPRASEKEIERRIQAEKPKFQPNQDRGPSYPDLLGQPYGYSDYGSDGVDIIDIISLFDRWFRR